LDSESDGSGDAARLRLFRTGREENLTRDCVDLEVVAMGTAKTGIVVVVVVALNVEHGEFPNEDGSEAGVQPRAASFS